MVFVAAGGEKADSLTFSQFADFWRRLMTSHYDEASQFVFVLAKGNSSKRSLTPEDFVPLIQDIVDTHPGLGFLKEATEFHSRYVHTVSDCFSFRLSSCKSVACKISSRLDENICMQICQQHHPGFPIQNVSKTAFTCF